MTSSPRRVLIVPDKFKGTLTAWAAAAAIARGWARRFPDDALTLLPMSDGGDGFCDVLAELLHAEARATATVDAAHQPRTARWCWDAATQTAVIESAQSIGLACLTTGQYHPFHLDTFGLGETIGDALALGARRMVIGLGGSATNDGGFGMARALGTRFIGLGNRPIGNWLDLSQLLCWNLPRAQFAGCEIIAACDVTNPLLGAAGCSRIYGPQKGLRPVDFERAEAALGRLAAVTQRQLGVDLSAESGSGAAGGLGFGVRAFLGGRLESGFEIFAQLADLRTQIAQADIVLTGEGGLDRQTLMGKGTGRIAALAGEAGKPCHGLAGLVEPTPDLSPDQQLFTSTQAIVPKLAPLSEAKARAAHWLETLTFQFASSATF